MAPPQLQPPRDMAWRSAGGVRLDEDDDGHDDGHDDDDDESDEYSARRHRLKCLRTV